MSFQLGPISEGTVNPRDLLPAFADALDGLGGSFMKVFATALADHNDRGSIAKLCTDLSLDLQYEINDLCPPYVYFGPAENDPACFGFWIDHDSIESDCRWGDLPSGDELPSEPSFDLSLFLVISDHGNMTLYSSVSGEWSEVWSCV